MAQPVWVLSVDLQTKTATFQSGMAEAARSARGAFTDIKSGSEEMGREVGGNMMEARHGVMLLGEEFGVHLPRALTTFIASIGPVGAAMEAAFPFLAIAVGATLLIEHLVAMHEAGEKLTQDQVHFGTAVQNAFNSLDQKLLQAQIKTDELNHDHLGALHKQLELIDKQSMNELVHAFGEVAKQADVVFGELKSHWYTFGIGSSGAKHALDQFQTQYESLIAQGKQGDASDLLKGTRESAERILAMQKQSQAALSGQSGKAGTDVEDQIKYAQASNELKKAGVGTTEKEVQAQQTLVDALKAQEGIQQRVSAIKKQDDSNAVRSTAGEMSSENAAAAKAAADSQLRINEQALAADRANASAKLQIQRATIQERMASDVSFADREYQIQLAGNQQLIGALDKLGKDYPNQLKALHEKAEELAQQHQTKLVEISAKGQVEEAAKELQELQLSEREKIEATRQGSTERLAAIDSAIKEEQSRRLQDTNFYRELMTQRTKVARQAAEEEAKLTAEGARLDAEQTQKMGELALAASREQQQLMDSLHHVSIQQRMREDIEAANQEYALKLSSGAQELAALDKTGKDYENKLKEIQNKQKQLIKQHENEVTDIKDKAEKERNAKIMAAESSFQSAIAGSLTQTLMGHKSFAATMSALGNQVVSGMLENAIKSIMVGKMTQLPDAAAAARKAYLAGISTGGPGAPVIAALEGAQAFAAMMAFEGGTDGVPGIGRGDTVPAMLTPGEGVVPGGVMDGLRSMARSGTMGGGHHYHVHAPIHFSASALDSTGMDKVLEKHSGKIQKHFENTLRKMNKS